VCVRQYLIVLSSNVANLLGAGSEFAALFPLLMLLGVSLKAYALLLPVILFMEFLLIFGLVALFTSEPEEEEKVDSQQSLAVSLSRKERSVNDAQRYRSCHPGS